MSHLIQPPLSLEAYFSRGDISNLARGDISNLLRHDSNIIVDNATRQVKMEFLMELFQLCRLSLGDVPLSSPGRFVHRQKYHRRANGASGADAAHSARSL